MKIDKNETYEQMIARQKAERKAMKKRLAEKEQQEKVLAAERLLAILRIFHEGTDDETIAAMYIDKMQQRGQTAKVEEAYEACRKINKKRKA